jgi:pimeloyl-ACP methyl ester carboxylesterase
VAAARAGTRRPPRSSAFEDLAALEPRFVVGISSGGALALEAAAAGVAMERLTVYEVPYNVDPGWPERWRAYVDELGALLAAGRRGDAFARFMRLAEVPEADIDAARGAPFWPALEALAPTLAYDAACLGDGRPPASFASIEQPALVVTGERDGAEWVRALAPAADALVALLPHGERATLGGGEHVAEPEAFAALLARWLTSR